MKSTKISGVILLFVGLLMTVLGTGSFFVRNEIFGLIQLVTGLFMVCASVAVLFIIKPKQK